MEQEGKGGAQSRKWVWHKLGPGSGGEILRKWDGQIN